MGQSLTLTKCHQAKCNGKGVTGTNCHMDKTSVKKIPHRQNVTRQNATKKICHQTKCLQLALKLVNKCNKICQSEKS